MQAKIVFAGSNHTSYQQAAAAVTELFELPMTDHQVRRLCKPIGAERCAERDAATAAYAALPLVERKGVPAGVTAPDLAVVGVDGGRLQIIELPESSDDAADEPIDDDGEERVNNGRHWREDKIGLLMTMTSDEHEVDPCPEIPETFVDPLRILKLTRELKTRSPAPRGVPADSRRSRRFWISSMRCRTCTRRRWRTGCSPMGGCVMCGGSIWCGRVVWTW